MGHILLAGGDEFGGQMAAADRRAISLAGGPAARIVVVPAAAAPDNNHHRAGQNGKRWFQGLGAVNVDVLPLIDRSSAQDPTVVAALRQAHLIYILGGFPQYLAETLQTTASWSAMRSAVRSGAVLAGSSAGAMVLCEHIFCPDDRSILGGLGLIGAACVVPHFNTYGKNWVPLLLERLPDVDLLGIDEQTAMISGDGGRHWQVYGAGEVHLFRGACSQVVEAGNHVDLDDW